MNVERSNSPRLEEFREHWWLYMLLGLITLAAGILAILLPLAATLAVTSVIGILLIVAGFASAAYAIRHQHSVGRMLLSLFISALYIVAGLILLAYPVRGALTLTLVLGTLFLVGGVSRIVAALQSRSLPNWGWELAGGILSVVLGLVIWSGWPGTAVWAIAVIVGVDLIYLGWTMVALSLMVHSAPAGAGPRLAGQH